MCATRTQLVTAVVEPVCDGRGIRDDLEQEDDEESYYRYMEENPLAGVNLDDDELDIEYDADGNAIIPEYKKVSGQDRVSEHQKVTGKVLILVHRESVCFLADHRSIAADRPL